MLITIKYQIIKNKNEIYIKVNTAMCTNLEGLSQIRKDFERRHNILTDE